ncbi:hypothetical protein LCGC14_0803930 [marine sediment metagenome]|uniref:Uncharacterized protein n=1 Tax=marine sediment metagenome TaxID=412755 RepID=A0A0F9S8V0_9ZZZZ
MSEEQKTVVEEVVDDAQPEQQQDTSQEVQPSSETATQDKSQDHNWREMRQSMEELKRHNYALETEITRISAAQKPKAEEEDLDGADEDISTVGQTKKLIRREASKIAREIVRQRESQTVEERLRLKYADYDEIVNKKNLETLFASAPELVKMLKAHQDDPYEQAIGAYKLMKQFGVSREDSVKLQDNQAKPRSVNSVGQTSALSQANAFSRGLTPDLRKQLYNEMKEAAKQA